MSPTAEKDTLVENKPLIHQLGEAKGSPEKAGQCCHFQSDWHWAVSLHSTVHDSALVANTGSSVTAAVQSKIAWKHEWMADLIHENHDVSSDWCLPVYSGDMGDGWIQWLTEKTWWGRAGRLFDKQLGGTRHRSPQPRLRWMTSDWQLVWMQTFHVTHPVITLAMCLVQTQKKIVHKTNQSTNLKKTTQQNATMKKKIILH